MGTASIHRRLLILFYTLPILGHAMAALAADQQILGSRLVVKDPIGAEVRRVVVVRGKQSSSSFQLAGNPTVAGALLQIVANGPTGSTQVLTLDAAGWSATSDGFRYEGPTTGDPVRRVLLKRTDNGTTLLKADVRGRVGTTDLVVTPPNPGDDGGLVLAFPDGDRYCVSFGGAAGGIETRDDADRWVIVSATATSSCPVSPSITTTTTSTTLPPCVLDAPACDGTCPAGYTCQSAFGDCYCARPGTVGDDGFCPTCDPPCTSGDQCMRALRIDSVPSGTQILVECGCATPPLCGYLQCVASCPPGSYCGFGNSMTDCLCRF